jgi:hypothetical protein
MSERDSGSGRGKGAAEGARRVALDHDEGWHDFAKDRQDSLGHRGDMIVRIVLPGARQPPRRKTVETVVGGIELWMLAGKQESRLKSAPAERGSYWLELDGFGTCTDDQNNATGQPSP